MIRFIIRRKYRSAKNGLETDELETVDLDVSELERILRGGGSGEDRYDYRTVAGVELLAERPVAAEQYCGCDPEYICPVHTPQPSEPDPDEVRRLLAGLDDDPHRHPLRAAARAWLRSREQQPDAGVPARDIDQDRLVAALAHRVCCGLEHDPANGKLHGDCVVCGVPWPCDTAKAFLVPAEDVRESLSDIIASVPTPTNALPMETELVDAPVPDGGRDGCHVLSDEERDRLFMMLDPDVQAHDEQEPLDTHGRIYRAGLERGRADVQARFQTVELDDVAHRALRQAAQDVLDEAPTIQTPDVQAHDDQEPLDTHGRIYRAGRERGRSDARAQDDDLRVQIGCLKQANQILRDALEREQKHLAAQLDAAVAREREECAKVADGFYAAPSGRIAEVIRAHSGAKEPE